MQNRPQKKPELQYISGAKLREIIQQTTNKVEQFNAFSKWLSFGNDGKINALTAEESEKHIKYIDLLANAVILDNTFQLGKVLKGLIEEGWSITRDELAMPLDHLLLRGKVCGGGARVHTQFVVDGGQMGGDRAWTDDKLCRYLGVGESLSNEAHDFSLADAQCCCSGGTRARGWGIFQSPRKQRKVLLARGEYLFWRHGSAFCQSMREGRTQTGAHTGYDLLSKGRGDGKVRILAQCLCSPP